MIFIGKKGLRTFPQSGSERSGMGIFMSYFQQLDTDLSVFYHASGIPLTLLDNFGSVISVYGEKPKFCSLFADAVGADCPCVRKHYQAALSARRLGEDYFWECPAGLYHFNIALVHNGYFLGSVLGGPVRLDVPDMECVKEAAETFSLTPSWQEPLFVCLDEILQFEPEQCHYIMHTLYRLLYHFSNEQEGEIRLAEVTAPVSAVIAQGLNYITEHYMEKLTLKQVAGAVNVSQAYFSKLFKEEMQQTFTEYLTNLRIGFAKELLRQTRLPILDVAMHVGFESQQYFSTVFKQKTGTTPNAYRLNALSENLPAKHRV